MEQMAAGDVSLLRPAAREEPRRVLPHGGQGPRAPVLDAVLALPQPRDTHRGGDRAEVVVGVPMIVRIRNWEKFQHYRHRSPPWIKLHRGVLDDDAFQALAGDDAKLLINLWLLASEAEGSLKTTSKTLAWRLRVASTRSVSNGLTRLVSALFITLTDDAGNVLAECLQDASEPLAQSRVEESRDREEGENNPPVAPLRATRETWLTPYFDAWVEAYQGEPSGKELARFITPLRQKHGDPAVIAAWQSYLSQTEGQFANPARFAKTYGTWSGTAARVTAPRKLTQRQRNEAALSEAMKNAQQKELLDGE